MIESSFGVHWFMSAYALMHELKSIYVSFQHICCPGETLLPTSVACEAAYACISPEPGQ